MTRGNNAVKRVLYLLNFCNLKNSAASYQQRCCGAGQAAGQRLRPPSGWSQAPQSWRCWSLAGGCSLPEWTPSVGCRCPVWTPWGGGILRSPLALTHRSGHCCRCWWRTGWSSNLRCSRRKRGGWSRVLVRRFLQREQAEMKSDHQSASRWVGKTHKINKISFRNIFTARLHLSCAHQ